MEYSIHDKNNHNKPKKFNSLYDIEKEKEVKTYDKNIFKVNEHLTLKLEGNETNIYVNYKKFIQCKYLLLNIPVEKIEDFDIYVCQICGNVEIDTLPKICPICEHEQIFFKKYVEKEKIPDEN